MPRARRASAQIPTDVANRLQPLLRPGHDHDDHRSAGDRRHALDKDFVVLAQVATS